MTSDEPDTPHVNLPTVMPRSEQQFWRSIPSRDNAVRIPPCLDVWVIRLLRHSRRVGIERSRKTEIGDLQRTSVGDEEIGSLHVSMQDMVLVIEIRREVLALKRIERTRCMYSVPSMSCFI